MKKTDKRRNSGQTYAMQNGRTRLLRLLSNRTLIVVVAALLGLVMTFKVSQQVQNQEYLSRALTLSESISIMPDVITLVESGDPGHELPHQLTHLRC